MIRNLKALGLALVAVFAMSAMAATASQASEFTSAGFPTTITATTEQTIGAESEYFESIGRKLECEVAHFTGTATENKTTLTVTPDYTDHTQGGNCKAGGLLTTTVTENSCDYTFSSGAKVKADHYKVGVSIACPGNPIEVHVGSSCTITVPKQTAVGDLTAINSGEHVNLSGSVEVESTVHSNSTLLCGVTAGTSKKVVTKYVVNKAVTVKGSNGKVSVSG